MQHLPNAELRAMTPPFIVATPIFARDQGTPNGNPDDKGKAKPKAKPAKLRKLSDFENEALKRIAKLDPILAAKLRAKLPRKKAGKPSANYIGKRIGKLEDRRAELKGLEAKGLTTKKGLAEGLKTIDDLQDELRKISGFYIFGIFPKWYRKLLKERAKNKPQGKSPTTKPASATSSRQAGRGAQDLLIGFAFADAAIGA
jgi:hypothetical protein